MNITAISVSFLAGTAVFATALGVKNLRAKSEVQVDRFKPFAALAQDEKRNKYEELLNNSKVPVKTAVALIIASGSMFGVVTYIVTGTLWLASLSMVGGIIIPKMWYDWHQNSNKKAVLKQMEKACEIMGMVLKTGSSLPEALERAAQESENPLRAELVRTATQIRVGVASSLAFMELVQRVEIPEMKIVSIAIDLQETGMAINIPSLFLQLQSDLRHKIIFEKQVSATTAEIKMSGFIVAAVPFVTLTAMRLLAPEFVEPLLTTPIGLTVFIVSTSMIFGGVRWMVSIAALKID